MRIVIAARPYRESCGGHIALHKLCDSLLRQGLPAYLRFDDPAKATTNPAYLHQTTETFEPDDVAVYHDSIRGNPWKARRIIRWMLYLPRHETDGTLLYYSPQFGPGPYLHVMEPQLDTFVDLQLPRSGACWAWRKAGQQGWRDSQKPQGGTEIRRHTSNRELVQIFNRHERFICYDGATFLAVQAALCGCDVVVPKPVAGVFPWPGIATTAKGLGQARLEHPQLRAALEARYREQDVEAANVMRWAVAQ